MMTQTDRDGNSFKLIPRHCPTCGPGAPETIVGMRGGRYHRHGLGVESQIVRCLRCELYYPNPFPVPRDPQRLYADPAKYFEYHDTDVKIGNFRKVVRTFFETLNFPMQSMLDVGSGQGEMLAAAQAEGVPDVVGLELSKAMIDASREKYGVEVRPELVEVHAERHPGRYDVVVLNAVLEHVMDPDAMIRACRLLIRPGGVLYIDIPNEDHLVAVAGGAMNRLRKDPRVFVLSPTFPPYHVFGFNPRSLAALLLKHSFEVERLETIGGLKVRGKGSFKDRTLAIAASVMSLASRPLGMGHNMFVWARPLSGPTESS